jgi:hypothetical protein
MIITTYETLLWRAFEDVINKIPLETRDESEKLDSIASAFMGSVNQVLDNSYPQLAALLRTPCAPELPEYDAADIL